MDLLEQFRQYLKNQDVSNNTCKNYVSDLSTFVDYLKSINQYFSILTLPFVLNSQALNSYKNWLQRHSPLSTGNRRLSSLRKFIDFAIENNLTSRDYTGQITNFVTPTKITENPLNAKGSINDIREIVKFIPDELTQTKEVLQYTNDINSYLKNNSESTSNFQKRFRLKDFLSWKKNQSNESNQSPTLIPKQENSSLSYRYAYSYKFQLLTIAISLLIIILALTIAARQRPEVATRFINDRFRALHEVVSKVQFPKITSSRFTKDVHDQFSSDHLALSSVLGTQDIIDPMSTDQVKKAAVSPLEKIMAYIINIVLPSPELIDPVR